MTSGVTDTPRSGRPPTAGGLAWHTLGADQVLQSERVDAQRGLSSAEAAARAQQFGPNQLAAGRAEPRWHAFVRQYRDPMQIVLLAAGIGSIYPLKQLGTGVLLILLTLFNAVEGLQQEGKAAASPSNSAAGCTTTSPGTSGSRSVACSATSPRSLVPASSTSPRAYHCCRCRRCG